jgi:hypothetical protein
MTKMSVTRNDLIEHAKGKLNITDFDPYTMLWSYDDMDAETTELMVQIAIDTLVQTRVDLGLEDDEEATEGEEGSQEVSDQG